MTVSLKSLIEGWEGVGVVVRYDQPTGTWIFIALHNDTLGPCTGGTRMKVYASPAVALEDAMRLGEGMTYKWAAVDMPFGGGKAVLSVPHTLEGEERHGLLTRYGELIESLRGTFGTGVDLGTMPDDMLVIGKVTSNVHGIDRATGEAIDPGPYTARGVLAGMHAAASAAFGSDDLHGKVVHIQGVGDVGAPLARLLKDAGADLRLSDVDTRRAEALAEELGGTETFEPHTAYAAQCDIYAPCAVGATLNEETIPELTCRVVAGSANNQLAVPEDAERLHERGILYAPDYIVNAGGAIALAMIGQGITEDAEICERIDNIGASLTGILREAGKVDESPVHAARRTVDERLAR